MKNKIKKFLSFFTALVIALGVIIPGASSVHAANTLNVAQYTKTSGVVKGVKGSNSGTYEGKWDAKIPMGKVMAGIESEMKSAADSGYYPHGKDGKNKIAYVEYKVKFPEGVTIDSTKIMADNSTSMFNKAAFTHTVSGQVVTFKFPLRDENWAGIYKHYKDDGGATSDKTIDISIPYTVKANSLNEAKALESKNVTAKGDFETHASGTWYSFTKKVYNTDVSTKPLAPDFSKSDVFVKSTEQDISQKGNLDGDLLVNGNTQHDKVYEANKNDSLTMTGLLNVSPIKKQLKELEDKYPSSGVATDIKVENVNTSFTAKMTLPEEMKFVDGYTVELAGANGKFKIAEQKVTGKTITVTLTVADNIKTFKEVKEAVYGVENDLKVNVKGVKFDTDKAKANTNYTINGMVSGKFRAKATNILTGNVINFDYIWEGVQLAGGEDSTDPTTKDIKLTLKYVETAENKFEATQKLLGDILVGDNTEHDKVYEVEKGTKVAFTGSLDVSPVKKQMKDIEEQFKKTNTDPSTIKISDYSSTFTATLTLPEEMDFEGNPQVSLLNDNGKYRIVSSSVSGKTIKVVMTVNKEVKSFAELKDAVNGMEDKLNVVVNGARFNNKASENTNYTVKGTMTGELKAKARETATGNVINFKLNWYAEQLPEGADAINPTSKDITFTLKYVAKKPPVNPTNPTTPGNEKPNNKLPRTGAGTSIALYTVLVGISGALIVGLKRRKNEN